MTFQPLIGAGGYSGWRLLSRTVDAQRAMVARDPVVARDTNHVRDKIGGVTTAEALVGDFRLLKTALSAYGLEADIGKKFFIRKVLESDLEDPKSFANRLSDKRYRAFAEAFGFGAGKERSKDLAEQIVDRHVSAELERRIGTSDGNLRLALNAKRELAVLGGSSSTDNARWYSILGSLPLRKVFEGAFGLRQDFGKLPIDRQLDEMKTRSERLIGSASPSAFTDPANVEKLLQRFLVRAEAITSVQSSYNAALSLFSR